MIVVFTGADDLEDEETSIEQFVKLAPKSLKEIIEKSGHRFVSFNNRDSGAKKRDQVIGYEWNKKSLLNSFIVV